MTEPSDPAKAPLDAAPVLHAGDKDTIVDTAAKPIHHAIKLLLDSFYPINMRLEYCLIFAKLSNDKLAYTILAIVLIFSVAEYQQPGWFPRPDQLSCAVIGFLGACTIIFPAIALFEYTETHTWPWEDEGFVWPWEALLWSSTVYNDEALEENMVLYPHPHPHNVSTTRSTGIHIGIAVGHGPALNAASGDYKSSSNPEASSEEQDMFIPPTPLLPRGLRPAHLPSPR